MNSDCPNCGREDRPIRIIQECELRTLLYQCVPGLPGENGGCGNSWWNIEIVNHGKLQGSDK